METKPMLTDIPQNLFPGPALFTGGTYVGDIFVGNNDKPKFSKEEFLDSLPQDTLFRWVHVPYSMIEVMWDYVDSCCIIASAPLSRMPEVKKEMRLLKQLKRDVDYRHKSFLSHGSCPWDEDDAVTMEDVFKGTFQHYQNLIRINLVSQYDCQPDDDRTMFWCCAYIAYIVCRATSRYMKAFRKKIRDHYNISPKDILCDEFYTTEKVLKSVIDKKPVRWVGDGSCEQWVGVLVNGMFDIQFIDKENKILEREIQ